MMKYLLCLLAFLGIVSCSTSQVSKYSKIEYEVGPCFGFCPIYKISIDAERNAVLEAEHFNFSEGEGRADFDKPREGTFRSVVSQEDFNQLIALTNKANVESLQDIYQNKNIMDASKTHLRVFYNNGNKKDVLISAGNVPENLKNLTNFMVVLKKKLKWEKVN